MVGNEYAFDIDKKPRFYVDLFNIDIDIVRIIQVTGYLLGNESLHCG